MRSWVPSLIGSAAFLVVAPGIVAGYVPWLLTHWHFAADFGESTLLQLAGLALLLLGGIALLECFVRFAWQGLGTPAPIMPTRHLVVSGLYRRVRNPMYVAVTSLILGQALLFGRAPLLLYAGAVWLAFHLFVLGYEEHTLRRQFPGEYERYRDAVPRWIPRLRPVKHDFRG